METKINQFQIPSHETLEKPESGLTLIETIVALFVLVTGITSGVGLAISAFGTSRDIIARVHATGYATEGVEVVRRMRDSNWLNDTLVDCSGSIGGFCYQDWLTEVYNISTPGDYRLAFDFAVAGNKWNLVAETPGPPPGFYRLRYDDTGGQFRGLYHGASGLPPLDHFRKVTIEHVSTVGDYSPQSPLVLVRSSVWWYGKGCNNSLIELVDPNDTNCKIIVEEYLTNWKDY